MELQIGGVSKTYANGVQALKDVTLTIPAGTYGVLGPKGAGKWEQCKILPMNADVDYRVSEEMRRARAVILSEEASPNRGDLPPSRPPR